MISTVREVCEVSEILMKITILLDVPQSGINLPRLEREMLPCWDSFSSDSYYNKNGIEYLEYSFHILVKKSVCKQKTGLKLRKSAIQNFS